MKKIYNKFLIISTIFLSVGGVYLYFSNSLTSEGITPVALGSSLSTSDKETIDDDKIASDISFLTTLVALKKIKIDTDFFNYKSFNALKNNSVAIDSVSSGRVNPFSPVEISSLNSVNNSIIKVITEQPSQITSTSAVLNGSVNKADENMPTYFEYSQNSQLLNPLIISTKQSLVGTFLKNILQLNPGAKYFYRACVKINNVASCGEIISFTTINS